MLSGDALLKRNKYLIKGEIFSKRPIFNKIHKTYANECFAKCNMFVDAYIFFFHLYRPCNFN